MNTDLDWVKKSIPVFLLASAPLSASAEVIEGIIQDKKSGEPLVGATIQIAGSKKIVVADQAGRYALEVGQGKYTLVVRYIGYKDVRLTEVQVGPDPVELNVEMEGDTHVIAEATVKAKRNLEGIRALQIERQKSTHAIENMGVKEMEVKGVSNVQEGVKKITGISIAESGQLIVRGLGDRYSATTLNGLPIASPNPDNKLIPLDLFPASTIRNITVSKVYEVANFADYSGACINISSKVNTGKDIFSVGLSVGGKVNTVFQDFYKMDSEFSLFRNPGIDSRFINMPKSEFESTLKYQNPFRTNFDVSRHTALPEFGGNIVYGKSWNIGSQKLSLLAAFTAGNESETQKNGFYKTLEAGGSVLDNFNYDKYISKLKMAGVGGLTYDFREADEIGYTFFYARNAESTYALNQGRDYEDHDLLGVNNVTHIYTLQNHQLSGQHNWGDVWSLKWNGSYSTTSSDEPDRRQLMYENDGDCWKLFKLNRQETMRYFGSLNEEEWVANLKSAYNFGEHNAITFGAAFKDKHRNFKSTRFYYNFKGFNPAIHDVFQSSGFMDFQNLANGDITIIRDRQPKDQYRAGHRIYAGFVNAEIHPATNFLVDLGVRYEYSNQWVDYATDGGLQMKNTLNKHDFFPAAHLKYMVNTANSLRLSFSRTTTRPSFIEMAPFLYQESYGSAMTRGNAALKNGYNYNLDLRYEFFEKGNPENMLSITGYAKILDQPIERTQTLSGGAAVHSFQNASNGFAAGVEIEFRRELLKDLRVGVNGSYMYTNVKLPEGGAYTHSQRALQGASPYLINADISYSPTMKNGQQITATILYNVQGPRIHAVGISGLGDEKQDALHSLDWVTSYKINRHLNVKLQLKDLIPHDIVFRQEIKDGRKIEVERYKRGMAIEFGLSYSL